MELAFKTITSLDIAYWVMGVTALRYLTATQSPSIAHQDKSSTKARIRDNHNVTNTMLQTPLSRGNDKQGAGVNGSENRGKDWMGDGGHHVTRDGGGCVVYRPGNDTLRRGRFSRRAKSLEYQRRTQAHANSAEYLSPGRTALREAWYQALEQTTAELEAGDFTTGAATGLAYKSGNLKEGHETATQAV